MVQNSEGELTVMNADISRGKLVVTNHRGGVTVGNAVIRKLVLSEIAGEVALARHIKFQVGVIERITGSVSMADSRLLGRGFELTVKHVSETLAISRCRLPLQDVYVEMARRVVIENSAAQHVTLARNGDVELIRLTARSLRLYDNEGIVRLEESRVRDVDCQGGSKLAGIGPFFGDVRQCLRGTA